MGGNCSSKSNGTKAIRVPSTKCGSSCSLILLNSNGIGVRRMHTSLDSTNVQNPMTRLARSYSVQGSKSEEERPVKVIRGSKSEAERKIP